MGVQLKAMLFNNVVVGSATTRLIAIPTGIGINYNLLIWIACLN